MTLDIEFKSLAKVAVTLLVIALIIGALRVWVLPRLERVPVLGRAAAAANPTAPTGNGGGMRQDPTESGV